MYKTLLFGLQPDPAPEWVQRKMRRLERRRKWVHRFRWLFSSVYRAECRANEWPHAVKQAARNAAHDAAFSHRKSENAAPDAQIPNLARQAKSRMAAAGIGTDETV